MSATLAEIRAGLETALEAIPNCQASAYMLDNPSPPTLQVMGTDEYQYHQAMANGLSDITLVVQAFAGSPGDRTAQEILDVWIDPDGESSVLAAIEADETLGGIVDDTVVQRVSGYRVYTLPNRAETLGCEFFVRIFNS